MTDPVSSMGRATVEYMDQHAVVETPAGEDSYPSETTYDEVEVLPNGWVRCVGPDDDAPAGDGLGRAVDYFPPGRVCGIFTAEGREDADGPGAFVDARAPSLIGALRSLTPLPVGRAGVPA